MGINASPLSVAALAAGIVGCLLAGTADASFTNKGTQAQDQRRSAAQQLPTCQRPLGTLAVVEPDDAVQWWTGQQLPAPSRLIKTFVSRSKCFTLVDRGAAMAASQYERELAATGELRGSSNVGKGQFKAADYVMVPDLVSTNSNAGGNAIGGLIGGLVGGRAGVLLGGLNLRSKTADVVLTVTDVRSSEQVAVAEGSARKRDLGFSAGNALLGGSGGGMAGVGGYANTEIGQVISMAYLQAYADIVAQLGGLPMDATSANERQAVTINRAGRLLANAQGTGTPVRSLERGMMLYPTGNKDGLMWEVEDELGNLGWVSSALLELAQ